MTMHVRAGTRCKFALRHLRARWPIVIWLTIVWVLLWGTFTWANLINGVIIAVVVMLTLPLPRVEIRGYLHPVGALRLAIFFVVEVVRASAQVSWRAFRPEPLHSNAIVGVQLRSTSEFVLITTGELMNLIPGSIMLELDTDNQRMFAHVLGADGDDEARAFRQHALLTEAKVIRAVGSKKQLAELRAETEPPSGVPDLEVKL